MFAQSTPARSAGRIRGDTAVFVIVGYPIGQAKAPEAFEEVFARFDIPAVLVPAAVAPDDLEPFVQAVLRGENFRGLWGTIPHKAHLKHLLARCDRWGEIAGAVNAVRREDDGSLTGALFDGEGFVRSLDHDGIAWEGRRVLLVGAGGAGAAIGASLACGDRRVAGLSVFDVDPGRAQALRRRLAAHGGAATAVAPTSDPRGFHVVVNASPLGMHASDPLPVDPARMELGAAFVDILMKNQPTPTVQAVRARGLVAQPGFEMMIQQVPLYLDFFGFHAAASAVRADCGFLRELLIPPAARAA